MKSSASKVGVFVIMGKLLFATAAYAQGGPPCMVDADCDPYPGLPYCDPDLMECVECIFQVHCAPLLCIDHACVECDTDEICDDDVYCNGQESCVDNSCQSAEPPCEGAQCNEQEALCECALPPGIMVRLEANNLNPAPGDNIGIEVFLESNPCGDLSAYGVDVDCANADGTNGSISFIDLEGAACPTGITCPGLCEGADPCFTFIPNYCGAGTACIPDDSAPGTFNGFCENTGTCLPGAFVDETRDDYIFSDATSALSLPDADCADNSVNVNAVNQNPGSTRVLDFETTYLGTFSFHVSDDADGDFHIEVLDSSQIVDAEGLALPFGTQGLTFTVEPCSGLSDGAPCDDYNLCTDNELCLSGNCVGEPICPPDHPCNPQTGECIPNDLCQDAIAVTVPSSTAGTTNGAAIDFNAPFCEVDVTAPGVWYSVIGTNNTMTASVCNPGTDLEYDPKISVYCNGCAGSDCCASNGTPGCDDDECEATVCAADPFCCDVSWDDICAAQAEELCGDLCSGGLTCVAGNDDNFNCPVNPYFPEVQWCSTVGAEYLILIHGWLSSTGDFVLNISDDAIECPEPVGGCQALCDEDADCDDNRFCNGDAVCVNSICIPAGVGVLNGDFVGAVGEAWTNHLPAGGGIDYFGSLTIVGPNAGNGGFAWAGQADVNLGGANLEFDLFSYASSDSEADFDYPVFYLDGTFYGLNSDGTLSGPTEGGNEGSGGINNGNQVSNLHFVINIEGLAGPGPHEIGFGVNSDDGTGGAGVAVFDHVLPGSSALDPCPGQQCVESNDSCVPIDEPTITLSLQASNSTPVQDDNVLIEAFLQSDVAISLSGYESELACSNTDGSAGSIEAVTNIAGQPCTGDPTDTTCPDMCVGMTPCHIELDDCPDDADCIPAPGAVTPPYNGLCKNSGSCLSAPYVDESRDDYLFANAVETMSDPDDSCVPDQRVNVNAVNVNPGSSVLPPGEQKYLGRYLYHVSEDAAGQFHIDTLSSSQLFDMNGQPLDFEAEGVTLTVLPQEEADVTLSLQASSTSPVQGDNVLIEAFLTSTVPIAVSQYAAKLSCSNSSGVAGSMEAVTDIFLTLCTGDASDTTCPTMCIGMTPCFVELDDCPNGEACISAPGAVDPPYNGLCENSGLCLWAPFVDEGRSDYIFADATETTTNLDDSCTDGDEQINVNAVNVTPGSSTLESDDTKYLGRFLYHVSEDAVGEFTFDVLGSTQVFGAEGQPLLFETQGVALNVQPSEEPGVLLSLEPSNMTPAPGDNVLIELSLESESQISVRAYSASIDCLFAGSVSGSLTHADIFDQVCTGDPGDSVCPGLCGRAEPCQTVFPQCDPGAACLPDESAPPPNDGFCEDSGSCSGSPGITRARDDWIFFDDDLSNCCFANGAPGCDDPVCQNTVCDADPYCCAERWDSACADAAQSCDGLCGSEIALDDACNENIVGLSAITELPAAVSVTPGERKYLGHFLYHVPDDGLGEFEIGLSPTTGLAAADGSDIAFAVQGLTLTVTQCLADPDCSDGLFCNGLETCESGFCQTGTAPCPAGFCDEQVDACPPSCEDNEDCPVDLPLCDPSSPDEKFCVQCLSNDDCDEPAPYCDQAGKNCVECLDNSHCDDGLFCNGQESCADGGCAVGIEPCPEELCDEVLDECLQSCNSDSDCTDPDRPVCHPNDDVCVGCVNDNDCNDGLFCTGVETCTNEQCQNGTNPCTAGQTCNEANDACEVQSVPECAQDADCDNGLFCDGQETCAAGVCISGSVQCGGQACRESDDSCVDCLTDADCSSSALPRCNADNECVECVTNSHCNNGLFCDGTEACVGGSCQSGSPPCAGQICRESNNTCVDCLVDSDCTAPEASRCLTTVNVCVACVNNSDCDDGLFCNGDETCDSVNNVCLDGSDPCDNEPCDEQANQCGEVSLRVEVSAPSSITPDNMVAVTVSVSNLGSLSAPNVTLLLNFESYLDVVSANGGTVGLVDADTNQIAWVIGAIDGGGNVSRMLTVQLVTAISTAELEALLETGILLTAVVSYEGINADALDFVLEVQEGSGTAGSAQQQPGELGCCGQGQMSIGLIMLLGLAFMRRRMSTH